MKKSIQSIYLDGGTNNSQKREVFKGSTLYKASYENNVLTIQFEIGSTNETENRHYAVFDSRQAIPDKYLPALASVSDESVTLFIFDVTHERIAFNEREKDLVSFGNWLFNKYGVKKPIPTNLEDSLPAAVSAYDLENWRHEKMSVIQVD